jgi:hypothetical protein
MFDKISQYYGEGHWTFKILLWILYMTSTIALVWALWVALAPVTIWWIETFKPIYCN